jgi:hypothetical protein
LFDFLFILQLVVGEVLLKSFCAARKFKPRSLLMTWHGLLCPIFTESRSRRLSLEEMDLESMQRELVGVTHQATRDKEPIPLPSPWEIDSNVENCGVCKDEFSFFTRKCHCRGSLGFDGGRWRRKTEGKVEKEDRRGGGKVGS